MVKAATILVFDADVAVRTLVQEVLSEEGYCVTLGEIDELHANALAAAQPDLLLVDLAPVNSAATLKCLERLYQQGPAELPPVVVTCTDPRLLRRLAPRLQQLTCGTVNKPFRLDTLTRTVCQALHTRHTLELPAC